MSQLFVVEFGARTIKVVTVAPTLRGPLLGHIAAVAREPEAEVRPWHVAAELLAGQRGLDGYYVRLVEGYFTHLVDLPSQGIRKSDLAAAVGGELEAALPLDLDDMTFAFEPAPSARVGTQRVLAYAMHKDLARHWLADGKASSGYGEPRGLLPSAGAAVRLIERLPSLATSRTLEPIAVVDIGASQTECIVAQNGRAVYSRKFARGGDLITNAMAAAWRMPWAEAERAKQRDAVVLATGSAASPQQQQVHHVVWSEVAPWLRELKQTLAACRTQTGLVPGTLLLVGGASRLAGLVEVTAEHVGVPTQTLSAADRVALGNSPDADTAALTIGAALDAAGGRPSFDLRQGELAAKVDLSFLRRQAVPLAVMAGAILLFGGIASYAKLRTLRQDERILSKRLAADTTALYKTPKSAKEVLLAAGPAAVANPMPALTAYDVLLDISAALPPATAATLDVMSIEIDHYRVQLKGNAKTIEEIDAVESKLKGIPCLKEVTRGETKTESSGVSRFQFTMKSTCMERS